MTLSISSLKLRWNHFHGFLLAAFALFFSFTTYAATVSDDFSSATYSGGSGWAAAWTEISTGYPSLAVSSIAIDSANPNVMYIGTGENYGYQYSLNGLDVRVTRGMYGIGILKTTDAGATWTKSLDWSYDNKRGVWKVIFNPKNRNILYAATSEGVWKTNDGGGTWSQVLNYVMAMDLEINPVDTGTLYVSIGDLNNNIPNANVGIYKTINSGGTWTKLSGGLPATWSGKSTIELYKRNPQRIYASIANDLSTQGLYISTNGGTTWTLQPGTSFNYLSNQGWYTNAFIVKDDDSSKVMVGGVDLFKSTQSGANLTQSSHWDYYSVGIIPPPGGPEGDSPDYAHADHHFMITNYKDYNKIYVVNDGGLFRSNDFGVNYYGCNGGYQTTQFYNGFSNSLSDTAFSLGGLQDNATARFEGGISWRRVFGGDGFWTAIHPSNNSIAYISYTYAAIYKSMDGAVNDFNPAGPPGSGSTNYCFCAPYIICRSDGNIMYTGGTSIYKSTTGGGSWLALNAALGGAKVLSMDASSTNSDTVYCGTIPVTNGPNATIWRTTDGMNWTDVGGGVLPNAYPTDIHVNPNNSREVYAAFSGFGNGHVYKTTNGGGTWTNITGNLPDIPHQSVCIDPLYPQNVYVGNDFSIYVSTNGGGNWNEYRNGMPYAMVFDLKIVYPNRHLRAATYGHGVYERSLLQNPIGIKPISTEVPKSFSLYQNFPNPFNPSTKIRFDIPSNSNQGVKIIVYDISGRQIAELLNENLKPGKYEITWNAAKYSSGIYFYKIQTGSFIETKKMLLVK